MLDQHAFQLEGADAVVGSLEDIIGTADVGDVAIGVAGGDVAGMVPALAEGGRVSGFFAGVTEHQAAGAGGEIDRDFTLAGGAAAGIQDFDAVAGQRPAHGPGLTGWPGELPTSAVVSVWPNPSRMVMPQAARTRSMISGFSGSPAEISSRSWSR